MTLGATMEGMGATVWRCSERALFWARLAVPACGVAGGAFVVAGVAGGTELGTALGFGGILLAYAAAIQRFVLYPSLEATAAGLIVRNPLSTKTVTWNEIGKITPGYGGLRIEVRGGSPVTVWCVQKTNWDMARGNRTRADDVADEIAAMGTGETSEPRHQFVASPEEKAEIKRSARVAIVVGTLALVIVTLLRIAGDSS